MRLFATAAFVLTLPLGFSLVGCADVTPADKGATPAPKIIKTDKFTYANYDKVRMTHLSLNLDVKFDEKVLDGTATIDFETVDPTANLLQLDTKDLTIRSVQGLASGDKWVPVDYVLHEKDDVMGSMLDIPFTKDMNKVRISYRTSPKAEGLQWLSPAQTAGKKLPYLFSQAQALNARTMTPVQDTPAVRITYDATLRVPDGLLPLMSAEQGAKDENGEYHFKMPQPIPSYLLAIAVGDIKFKAINDHIGVYAESYILDAAAEEFSETPMMEDANTRLYGPYMI